MVGCCVYLFIFLSVVPTAKMIRVKNIVHVKLDLWAVCLSVCAGSVHVFVSLYHLFVYAGCVCVCVCVCARAGGGSVSE